MDGMGNPAVLFDLDGTLTDPKPGITRCVQHALRTLGHEPPPEDELLWCIGPPLQESFPRLLGTGEKARIDEAIRIYRERFSTIGLFENALYQGIPEVLGALRKRGLRTFVASSKPRVFVVRILEHFGLLPLFDAAHGSELDGTRTDKAELIAHVLEVERLDPACTVMVGDREHDMIGGMRNGLRCVGVTYGYGSAEELTASGAACLAATPDELLVVLAGLLG